MKAFFLNFYPLCLTAAIIIGLQTQCKKEPAPEIFGNWQTISPGFQWHYQIDQTQFCRTLPEYFGETQFCFNYQTTGDTLNLNFNQPEKWIWDILEKDVAVITNVTKGESYIVKRTK